LGRIGKDSERKERGHEEMTGKRTLKEKLEGL